MRAGALNERIEILARVKSLDDAGATSFKWQHLTSVWANIRHESGKETLSHDVITASVRASVRIRWRSGITPDMRIKTVNGVYEIEAVLPDLGGRVFVDLVCRTIGNES